MKTTKSVLIISFLTIVFSLSAISQNKEIEETIKEYYKIQKYTPHEISLISVETTQETSQAIVDIKYRKRLFLHKAKDGWQVLEKTKANNAQLTLMDFQIKLLPIDNDQNRFSKQADVTFFLKNTSPRTISAWKATLIAKNSFGETLFTTRLTEGDTNIKPGETKKTTISWSNNRFIDNEPYDFLSRYAKDNLNLKLINIKTVTQP